MYAVFMPMYNSSLCRIRPFFRFHFDTDQNTVPEYPYPYHTIHIHTHIQQAMAGAASNPWARFAFRVSIILLFILSLAGVALYGRILAFISHPVSKFPDDTHNSFHPVFQGDISILPLHLNVASSRLALATNVISLFISMCCMIFTIFFWPNGKRVSNLPII
jgi:hypothetical protein